MATELLVDTSDDTAVVGTTNWTPNEERPALHDFYSSMADIQIGVSNNEDTLEQETVFWSDEMPRRDETLDNRWTIDKDQISDVGRDDMLLLLEDLPTAESPSNKKDFDDKGNVNGTTSTAPIETSDDPFATASFLGSKTSTPKASGPAKETPSPMASFLNDTSPSATTIANNVTVDNTAPTATGDILFSPMAITNLSHASGASATTPTDSPSSDSLKATSSHSAEAVTTTPADSPNTNETSTTAVDSNNEDDWVMKLSLQAPNGQQEILLLHGVSEKKIKLRVDNSSVLPWQARDPREDVHAFCKRHDILQSEDYVYENVKKKYQEKKANILLGGGSKKKKKKKKEVKGSTQNGA